ncbi:hypothetical protein [Streptomyces sp. NPDC058625]|uniref:hypothetical protein n=1 Tax=Streptomyces sp. NPDC058625 TaxID=3346564 RepID=UPI00364CE32C
MHSDPAIESRADDVRGRRHSRRSRRGKRSGEGPVFVDSSGRRARLLRRIGLLAGTVCVGYAFVLGLTFLGIGTSVTPASLLPFGDGRGGAPGQDGGPPGGGTAPTGAPPTGAPPTGAPPTGSAPPTGGASPTGGAAS